MKKLAIIPAAVAALALAGSVASAQTPAVVVKTPAPHKVVVVHHHPMMVVHHRHMVVVHHHAAKKVVVIKKQ